MIDNEESSASEDVEEENNSSGKRKRVIVYKQKNKNQEHNKIRRDRGLDYVSASGQKNKSLQDSQLASFMELGKSSDRERKTLNPDVPIVLHVVHMTAFLSEFIELYRSFPFLSLVKSKEYSDRNKTDLAYVELVKKYKEFDPLADRNIVVKKIGGLRTVYKKELAKVKRSSKSGAGADDIYKPSLWYFDLLQFLDDQDSARPTRSTMDDHEDDEEETQQETTSTIKGKSLQHRLCQRQVMIRASASSRSMTPAPNVPRQKRKKNLTSTDEVLQLAGQQLKAIRPDDEFDAFGKYVAHKLRLLKGNQSVSARKLMNDVIYEGELETLTNDYKVMISPSQQFNPQQLYPPLPNPPYFPQQSDQIFYSQTPTLNTTVLVLLRFNGLILHSKTGIHDTPKL
ncbi:hypothetical protein J6590_100382 [Homalodisca vitripennis]|nr:hypothetical protein J6590_100382 [Homalodisca vitripennis]